MAELREVIKFQSHSVINFNTEIFVKINLYPNGEGRVIVTRILLDKKKAKHSSLYNINWEKDSCDDIIITAEGNVEFRIASNMDNTNIPYQHLLDKLYATISTSNPGYIDFKKLDESLFELLSKLEDNESESLNDLSELLRELAPLLYCINNNGVYVSNNEIVSKVIGKSYRPNIQYIISNLHTTPSVYDTIEEAINILVKVHKDNMKNNFTRKNNKNTNLFKKNRNYRNKSNRR